MAKRIVMDKGYEKELSDAVKELKKHRKKDTAPKKKVKRK